MISLFVMFCTVKQVDFFVLTYIRAIYISDHATDNMEITIKLLYLKNKLLGGISGVQWHVLLSHLH